MPTHYGTDPFPITGMAGPAAVGAPADIVDPKAAMKQSMLTNMLLSQINSAGNNFGNVNAEPAEKLGVLNRPAPSMANPPMAAPPQNIGDMPDSLTGHTNDPYMEQLIKAMIRGGMTGHTSGRNNIVGYPQDMYGR